MKIGEKKIFFFDFFLLQFNFYYFKGWLPGTEKITQILMK